MLKHQPVLKKNLLRVAPPAATSCGAAAPSAGVVSIACGMRVAGMSERNAGVCGVVVDRTE
jgi:hypothetical protein